ncbi:hypothetical protein PCANC_21519 [Puccinia coronata f. sp. avenae]|uniref:Uncharacterized protein n=1 Tax=Puccinia coronata f. sp. avenae TaxID=200324 RepID=A0A2N5TNH6_9BASI|nr:hypothetical protein PCANC_21519 [Puccinia coronata f. sp. avenae]
MQLQHLSHPGSSQRQQLQTHYEHQHPHSNSHQCPITQNKSPSNLIFHSSSARPGQSPGGRPSAPLYHGLPSNHQASHSQPRSNGFPSSQEHLVDPSPEMHQQKKSSALSHHPPRSSKSNKTEKLDELPRGTGSS